VIYSIVPVVGRNRRRSFQYLTVEDIITRSMIKIDGDFYKCTECGKTYYNESSRAGSTRNSKLKDILG